MNTANVLIVYRLITTTLKISQTEKLILGGFFEENKELINIF